MFVLFGFAAAGAAADAVPFLDAVLFNFALIAFLLLDLPYDPLKILPFLDFLSPRPIRNLNNYGAIIVKSCFITKSANNFSGQTAVNQLSQRCSRS